MVDDFGRSPTLPADRMPDLLERPRFDTTKLLKEPLWAVLPRLIHREDGIRYLAGLEGFLCAKRVELPQTRPHFEFT
ncbi:MAG: hypothetical protein VX733_00405 [Candidatus Latescibacterota bacterium]|nr:hypothetical protein [Candidatus Latescibacterota bacterium]